MAKAHLSHCIAEFVRSLDPSGDFQGRFDPGKHDAEDDQ